MSLVAQLVGFGLRQVIGDFADNAVQVIDAVEQRFRDHSRTLPKALENAHQRAWQALGVALAGDGLLDRVKVFFASGDDKGVREQVQLFLNSNADSFDGTPADFRRDCLDELKRLRKSGLLAVPSGAPTEIARQAAGFRRHADGQGLIEESRRAVAGVAEALADGYPNLARLLRTPTPAGPPLLAAAFCYFFRREVETDDELAHGLFFDGLRQLSASQARAFGEVGKALAALGGQFDAVFEQMGRIETAVAETHGAVLDVQAELQRLGGLHLANAGEVRTLLEQVLAQLGRVGMARGEVRPGDSCSIRGEDERRAVKALLARFRHLPAEEQRRAPALLNGLGKLQVGAGDFAEARQTFTEVVRAVGDPADKAEASFNTYRAALEEKQWDAALAALREAASHDPQRFTPFPLHRYEPQRILGAGGFGTAILCRDRHFDEDVVVKTLHAADLARGVDDVFREARILRRLSHPAIIGVRDCEYADPAHMARPYLVMDHFPGGTLQQFVEKRGPLSLEQLLAVAVQTAEGMRAAHAQGILHRDLKPANLLVRKEGDLWTVKIIDFGLALRQQTVETSKVRSGATPKSMLDWSLAGTLDYAAPEQMGRLPGVATGPYSDIYGLGRTLCYALFGTAQPVFSHWRSLTDSGLSQLLGACIEERPADRPQEFGAVLEKLYRVLSPKEIEALEADASECELLSRTLGQTSEWFKKVGPARVDQWRKAAEQGSAVGQWLLGNAFYEGGGLSQDSAEALRWLRKAAEQGHAYAQADLGAIYMVGKGVPHDDAEALRWVRKAEKQGCICGNTLIGLMYMTGKALEKDDTEAVRRFRVCAEQGNAYAQVLLGVMYQDGRGVEKDDAEAVKWYRRAAERGNALAQNNLGVMYNEGRGVARDHAEALKWYRKAAEQGNATAQNNLGVIYLGHGVPRDDAEAANWFRKAAEQGNAMGQLNLGVMYRDGRGVPRDDAEAVNWFRKAADQGNATAQNNLGVRYLSGHGVPRDDAEAVNWLRKSAEQGNPGGQKHLGLMYNDGRGVPRDYAEALKWYHKAAEQGDATAQNNIGVMYVNGQGVPKDEATAVEWFRKAAAQGLETAKEWLKVATGLPTTTQASDAQGASDSPLAAPIGDMRGAARLLQLFPPAAPRAVRFIFYPTGLALLAAVSLLGYGHASCLIGGIAATAGAVAGWVNAHLRGRKERWQAVTGWKRVGLVARWTGFMCLWFLLGVCYPIYLSNSYDTGVAEGQKAAAEAGVLIKQGRDWVAKEEYDKAISCYTEAIRIAYFRKSLASSAYVERGAAYMDKNALDSAIADFTKAIELDPKSSIAYDLRGQCYSTKGDKDKAAADHAEAVRLNLSIDKK